MNVLPVVQFFFQITNELTTIMTIEFFTGSRHTLLDITVL